MSSRGLLDEGQRATGRRVGQARISTYAVRMHAIRRAWQGHSQVLGLAAPATGFTTADAAAAAVAAAAAAAAMAAGSAAAAALAAYLTDSFSSCCLYSWAAREVYCNKEWGGAEAHKATSTHSCGQYHRSHAAACSVKWRASRHGIRSQAAQ